MTTKHAVDGAEEQTSQLKFGALSVLGAVTAALSLFSLAEKAFDFGLSMVASEALAYYRDIAKGIANRVLFWTEWRPGSLMLDCWTLSLIGGAISARTTIRTNAAQFSQANGAGRLVIFVFSIVTTILLGLSFLGLLIVFGGILGLFSSSRQKADDESRDAAVAGRELALTFLMLVIFFAINAYAPSVT